MSYKTLLVYHKAHAFGQACHDLSLRLPKFEMFETGSQLRRAAKSVSVNIVEGYGRKEYPADYLRFLVYALASNDESTEWLTYLKTCHPDHGPDIDACLAASDEVGRMLNKLIQSLR